MYRNYTCFIDYTLNANKVYFQQNIEYCITESISNYAHFLVNIKARILNLLSLAALKHAYMSFMTSFIFILNI